MKYTSLILVALCVAAFVLAAGQRVDDFILVSSEVAYKPWMLVTHMFLHASLEHLFYNMFALGLFGFILENIIGSKRFLAVYFGTGIMAAVAALPFYEASLGASGAIFGVLGCLAFLRPRMTVWVAGVPMPMVIAAAVWALIDLVGVLFPSDVANIAHLAGMAAGIAAGFLLKAQHAERKRHRPSLSEKEMDEWEEGWMQVLI